MKSLLSISCLSLALTFLACESKKELPSEINFMTDYKTALDSAKNSGKNLIIDFYTEWCRWCDSLDANTYTDSLVISLSAENIFVKIDAEADTALADTFGVSGYPTIIIANSKGEEIDRIWGYLPPTEFYNQVQLYLQGRETLEDYLSRLADEPENLEYLSMIGEKYASRSEHDNAAHYYEKIVEIDKDNEEGYAAKALASLHDSQSRAKDYNAALETCKRLMQLYPDTPESDEAAALLGYYTAKNNNKAGALGLYRDYLTKNPEGENADWVRKRIADLEGE